MSKRDTLKTAKISIAAEEQAADGYQDRHVKKARRKERQKGKKVIKEELKEYNQADALFKVFGMTRVKNPTKS